MVKHSMILSMALLLGACVPNPTHTPLTTGQVGIQVIWPQQIQGFATQASYSEAEQLGVTSMRLSLKDSIRTHNQSVAFKTRRANFTGIARGAVSVTLECLDSSGQVLYRGEGSGSLASANLNLPVAVEAMQDLRTTNSLGMKFVKINPGTFLMGSPSSEADRGDDETQHQVTLNRGFYLQTTEVTQGQWQAVMNNNPSGFKGDPNLPVVHVSWQETQEFIQKLNTQGQGSYRLPTEAEWEYAARAGTTTAWACGGNAGCLDSMAWYRSNSGDKTHPVGQKQPNAWGLYDMHGNVWEWVQDWYGNYPSSAVTDPNGPGSGSERVARGGSWHVLDRYARSAVRASYSPGYPYFLGFRLVRE